MSALEQYLTTAGQQGFLSWDDQQDIARRFNLKIGCVEKIALQMGILPVRYLRNQPLFTCQDQLKLFSSHVVIVGCGGLGGLVVECLARLGVGRLSVIDPDTFEEHNLNRQFLATFATLGRHKVDVAVERVAQVNPAVSTFSWCRAFSQGDGAEMLSGATVVVDALDNVTARLELSAVCRQLDVPLVHAAIDGYYGHILSQWPSDNTIEALYSGKNHSQQVRGQGNPSFTPAVLAAMEVAEVCKIVLGCGSALRHRLLNVNLLDMEFVEIDI